MASHKPLVVLCLKFDIGNMEGVSYRAVPKKDWEKLEAYLKLHPDKWFDHPYYSNPPMEFYGENMSGQELLEKIEVITDPKKVEGFIAFHGRSFFVLDDLLERIIDETLAENN